MAWRVRDLLAAHPLLGGPLAQIQVCAGYEIIYLDGWAFDEKVRQLALRLATRAAGHRAIDMRVQVRCSAPSAPQNSAIQSSLKQRKRQQAAGANTK